LYRNSLRAPVFDLDTWSRLFIYEHLKFPSISSISSTLPEYGLLWQKNIRVLREISQHKKINWVYLDDRVALLVWFKTKRLFNSLSVIKTHCLQKVLHEVAKCCRDPNLKYKLKIPKYQYIKKETDWKQPRDRVCKKTMEGEFYLGVTVENEELSNTKKTRTVAKHNHAWITRNQI
jgi:hypothetical protein